MSLSNFDTIVTPDSREKMFMFLAKYLDKYLVSQRDKGQSCCSKVRVFVSRFCFLLCSHSYGNVLSAMYMLIKAVYCANVFVQMLFLNLWMGPGYYSYGINVIRDVTRHVDWTGTWRFPRITLCDFSIRTLG